MTEDSEHTSLDALKTDAQFIKDNAKTLTMIEYINKFLYGLGEVYTIAYINMHSVFLETQGNQKNSNLIIVNKGFGKTTFLKAIAENNKKHVRILPEKMYESFLSKEKPEYFKDKILVHYDLIQGIFGLDKKQKEQLIGFWTSMLSDGKYHRQNVEVLKDIKCIVMFAMAKESYMQHRKSLFESTFSDRVTMITKQVDYEEKQVIYRYRAKAKANPNPEKFILKLHAKKKDVKIDFDDVSPKIMPLVMQLDKFDVMTSTRGQDYVYNFLLCNALVNGRNRVNDNDIKMYKFFHTYHIDKEDISKYNKVAKLLDKNPMLKYDEICHITKMSRRTVAKFVKMYKEKTDKQERQQVDTEFEHEEEEENLEQSDTSS